MKKGMRNLTQTVLTAVLTLCVIILSACDDYDMSRLGHFDGLSVETEKRIISDYQKQNPDFKLRDIWITAYYGTYNDVVFVEITLNGLDSYPLIAPYQDICIGGITLIEWKDFTMTYDKGRVCAMVIWHNGQFYRVEKVYDSGLVTLDTLKSIADSYFGGWVECTHSHH